MAESQERSHLLLIPGRGVKGEELAPIVGNPQVESLRRLASEEEKGSKEVRCDKKEIPNSNGLRKNWKRQMRCENNQGFNCIKIVIVNSLPISGSTLSLLS